MLFKILQKCSSDYTLEINQIVTQISILRIIISVKDWETDMKQREKINVIGKKEKTNHKELKSNRIYEDEQQVTLVSADSCPGTTI